MDFCYDTFSKYKTSSPQIIMVSGAFYHILWGFYEIVIVLIRYVP